MGKWEKAKWYLHKKMKVLEKIAANTETQHRFIHKREIKGLERVLGERDLLLEELSMLNDELAKDQTWRTVSVLTVMNQEINYKQQEVLERSKQVLKEAMIEKNCIATELKNGKIHQKVRNRYVNSWVALARGGHLNARG